MQMRMCVCTSTSVVIWYRMQKAIEKNMSETFKVSDMFFCANFSKFCEIDALQQ